VSASPFQARIGSTIAELEAQGFALDPQPAPYEYLMGYPDQKPEDTISALITPEDGLCEMRWTISVVPLSPGGMELKNKYLELYTALLGKFGKPVAKEGPADPAADDELWKSIALQAKSVSATWRKSPDDPEATTMKLEARSDQANQGVVRLSLAAPWVKDCLSKQSRATQKR
jgi:hypothetical protein